MNLMWPQPSPPPIPMAAGLLHAPRGQVWFVLYIRLTRKGSHTAQSCLSSVAYILKHHFPLLPLASSATPLPTNLFPLFPPPKFISHYSHPNSISPHPCHTPYSSSMHQVPAHLPDFASAFPPPGGFLLFSLHPPRALKSILIILYPIYEFPAGKHFVLIELYQSVFLTLCFMGVCFPN